MAYTKLFQSIVTSSIWTEDDKTRIVWITMLALADRHGEIQASIPGLARVSGVSIADTEGAIAKLLAPDPYSRTTDDEGRRIEKIEGGWALLNHAKYREMASDDDRKTKAAVRQKRFRDKESRNNNASVTPSNAPVTHESRQIPQAEAKADTEAKAKQEKIYTLTAAPVRSDAGLGKKQSTAARTTQALQEAQSVELDMLASTELKLAWIDWQEWRTERATSPLTGEKVSHWTARSARDAAKGLMAIAAKSESKAIDAIAYSISKRYTGIFERPSPLTASQPFGNPRPKNIYTGPVV